MISPDEIKVRAERKYINYLQSILLNQPFFPLLITGDKNPGKSFTDFQTQMIALVRQSKEKKGFGFSIEYKTVQTKTIGTQSIPVSIFFDAEKDYLKYLGKEKEVSDFRDDCGLIEQNFPEVSAWLLQNPLKVVQYHPHWTDILKVCVYFKNSPKPDLYIRELPAGVHTKFIENFKSILRELLDIIIAPFVNVVENEFEKRFHLKYSEPLVRFKILDPHISTMMFTGIDDISIPVSQFNALKMPLKRAIIVENKTSLYTTLTLPKMEGTIAVFGKGYGISLLKNIDWLGEIEILYWGDIDAHGFEILSQLRGYFPQTESRLMDMETFEKFFENDAGTESSISVTLNLNDDESLLYNKVKSNNWRLEQEKLPVAYVNEIFNK